MYFRKFPSLAYPKEDGQLETIQDILIRVGFVDGVKEETQTLLVYNIEEGSTPESIAEEVYGDQKLFWLVLLFNDFLDPLYSIPLRSRSLDQFINKNYPSKTLFLSPEGDASKFYTHPFGGTSTVPNFREGDTITLYLGGKNKYKDTGDDRVIGVVKRFIPELSAIQLESLEGVIEEGDVIARGYDTEIRASVRKVVDSKYAAHHFSYNGNKINPMATPPDDNGNQVPIGQTGDGFSTAVGVTQTVLENYINDSVNLYTITNEDYEFNRNEQTRSIKLLSPELVTNVLREFREVLR